jgi:hypothetical protein
MLDTRVWYCATNPFSFHARHLRFEAHKASSGSIAQNKLHPSKLGFLTGERRDPKVEMNPITPRRRGVRMDSYCSSMEPPKVWRLPFVFEEGGGGGWQQRRSGGSWGAARRRWGCELSIG